MIRTAQESDFNECVAIARRTWPQFLEREAIFHIFCKYFRNTCFVNEEDGKVNAFLLGFISQVSPDEAYVHLIISDRSAQRRGIARALYMEFFRVVRQSGTMRVRLTVDPANKASLTFHHKLGFQPEIVGERIQAGEVWAVKNFNGENLHMVPFVRELREQA
jgi:predicted GNAT superfamily acetyltransferase